MHRFSLIFGGLLAPALLVAQAPRTTAPDVIPAPATTLPLKYVGTPTTAAIDSADLMTRLYIFADDSMQGREAGTIGNVKGTDYLAREAAAIGLKPAGDSGTYFQTLPFKTRSLDSSSTLIADGAPLVFGTEWAAMGSGSLQFDSATTMFGGVAGDTANALDSAQAAGKMVIVLPGQPTSMAGLLSSAQAMAPGATAVAILVPPAFINFAKEPSMFVDDGAATPDNPESLTLFISPAAVQKLLGKTIAQLVPGTEGATASANARVSVVPVEFPARNVVAVLPGSDPSVSGQYVAIGAHNDHVGFNTSPVDHDSLRIFNHIVRPGGAENQGARATPAQMTKVNEALAAWRTEHPGTQRLDSIFNGADDDGSGSVTVLEIAQHLASLPEKPRRSILFVWHVGEEKGLLGSEYFTDHPTVPRDSIVAQLNMDMVGRGNVWDVTGATKSGEVLRGGDDYLQIVGSRRLSTELGDLIEQVDSVGGFGLKFDYSMDADGHPMNIYCRSDHYEYARYGIPVAFFTTGGHSDYHQLTDEPQYIDFAHMARIGNFVSAVALQVANLDHRIVVDQPVPDPHGSCRQ